MRCVVTVMLVCVGCSSKHAAPTGGACEKTGRGDVFAVGLAKRGASGHFEFKLISATPAPPARGDNKWVVEVDAVGGGAVPRAEVEATPFMPDHGHGTPMKVVVTPLPPPGQYQLAPVNLWMPGYWETSVTATLGNDHDSAVFKFCIGN